MRKYSIILLSIIIGINLQAQFLDSNILEKNFMANQPIEKELKNNVLQIAPLIGTDIGFAIPYGHIPKKFQPFPKLNISLGLWFNYVINPHWQVGLNMTYKTVALSANAKMQNEIMKEPGKEPLYFTGLATQSMSFTMLEFPLIAKYGFGQKCKYRVMLGGYGAWIPNKSFLVTAKSGYQGDAPYIVNNIISPESPFNIDFSNTLRNWEAGVVAGYEQSITDRLNFDVVVYSGVKNIFISGKEFLTYSMLPFRIGVHVTYSLFEFAPNQDNKFRFVYK